MSFPNNIPEFERLRDEDERERRERSERMREIEEDESDDYISENGNPLDDWDDGYWDDDFDDCPDDDFCD